MKDPSFTARRATAILGSLGMLGEDELSRKTFDSLSRLAFFQDPPRHTKLRQLIMKGFSPSAVEWMRPRVVGLVQRAAEKARRDGEMDVVSAFSEAVALNTLAEMFVIPEADRPQFMRWSTDLLKLAGGGVSSDEQKRAVKQSCCDMIDYMMRLVEERRKAPGEDVASRFIEAEGGDTELAGEAAMQCFQMVAAGFVTSVNQIANTVLALLNHPAELAKLREAPGLVRGAVEERLVAEDEPTRGFCQDPQVRVSGSRLSGCLGRKSTFRVGRHVYPSGGAEGFLEPTPFAFTVQSTARQARRHGDARRARASAFRRISSAGARRVAPLSSTPPSVS
ncbi:cytochrome P450 [Sorangium sp. So ce281]|uniref:cytochrome P450 n=1 Tax=unclassified Sorangium TaxID=2621164 RepID=UPI003F5EE673